MAKFKIKTNTPNKLKLPVVGAVEISQDRTFEVPDELVEQFTKVKHSVLLVQIDENGNEDTSNIPEESQEAAIKASIDGMKVQDMNDLFEKLSSKIELISIEEFQAMKKAEKAAYLKENL